jgi:hypothetical protein
MSRLMLSVLGAGFGIYLLAGSSAPDDPRSTASLQGTAGPLVLHLSTPQNELRMGERPTVNQITNRLGKPVTLVEPSACGEATSYALS